MDAITMLRDDHSKMREMFGQLTTKGPEGADKSDLISRLERLIKIHSKLEEEIFYPAFKDAAKGEEDRDMFFEAVEEHHVVDLLMGELESMDVSDESWGAKAIVMKENIEHHIEEEEGEMFAIARRIFDADELDDLGERMAARKESVQRELGVPVAS